MHAGVNRMTSNQLFVRTVTRVFKPRVDLTIDKCRLSQVYTKARKVNKTSVPLLPSILPSGPAEKFKKPLKREGSRQRKIKQCRRLSRRSQSPKRSKLKTTSISRSQMPRRADGRLHIKHETVNST